ncbi:hypothetical protein [Sodalinema gerasimenkoae]|uniref:hypothetical protein n=1 Tax=Sodalinema gerasimenkoae TaxID=2862348 RepID=UPI00135B9C3E|nr:hypothetical protein [Sodalinema gerasimenkoae]
MQYIDRELCDRYNPFGVILIALGCDRITDRFSCKVPLIPAIPTGVKVQSFGRGCYPKSLLDRSISPTLNSLQSPRILEQTVYYSGNV